MEKKCIKRKVISAYKDAKRYPDFMPRFKANLQDVIDSEVPEQDSSSSIPWTRTLTWKEEAYE